MAQRAKYKYRGQTHTRPSRRPGKRAVTVRAYCRRQGSRWQRAFSSNKAKEWGF